MSDALSAFIHATALVFGEDGVIIEGASGSGKSSLAAALMQHAMTAGLFARLVGDDRIGLAVENGRLLAYPHPRIAGLIERRGSGLLGVDHEPTCVLTFAVRLVEQNGLPARLPEAPASAAFCGIALPLLVLPVSRDQVGNAARLAEALADRALLL